MQIRKVKPQDAERLLPLLIDSDRYHNVELNKKEVDEKGLETQARNYLPMWFKPQHQGYVLEHESRIVGFAMAQTGNVVGEGWIYDLYVSPKYRRQGWAGKLIKQCIDWLRSQGVRTVMLDVAKNNSSAQQFYDMVGFKEAPPTWLHYKKHI